MNIVLPSCVALLSYTVSLLFKFLEKFLTVKLLCEWIKTGRNLPPVQLTHNMRRHAGVRLLAGAFGPAARCALAEVNSPLPHQKA